jgi:hypothetical protein
MLQKYAWLLAALLVSSPLLAQRKESPNFVRMAILATDMNRNILPGTGVPQVKPGFSFGMGRNFVLANGVNLQPSLEYTPRGYRSRRNLTDSTYFRSWNGLHYVDFALTLGLSVGGYTKFYVDAAPYVAFGVYGRNRLTDQQVRTLEDSAGRFVRRVDTRVTDTDPFKNELKRWDYGYRVSMGLRRNGTVVGIMYSEGLADLHRRDTFFVRNRTFGIFLTSLFDDMF